MFAWQALPNRGPEGFQSRRRRAHAPRAVQTARHEPRLGDLARDRTVLLVELNLGHLFLILVSRAYCVLRYINACETTRMPSFFVDEVSDALSEAFETRTTGLPSTPSSSSDTWKSSPFSSEPTIELTASVITVATVWFIPL